MQTFRTNDNVRIYMRPRLVAPVLITAWPGVGNVASIVAGYLRKKLEFKELGEVEASRFFDPIGVVVKDNVVEAPQFPQSKFYYRKSPNGGSSIILFIGEDQPATKAYELANCVLDVAVAFKVRKIFTCAAAITRIHHSEQPKVWGVVTNQDMVEELKQYDLKQRGNMQIAGLNGIFLGVAKERGVDGICLLGEVPSYATRMHNPIAALAILRVLSRVLNITIDTRELAQLAFETQQKMKQLAAEAMEEYIDFFTEPIWESEEEEEEED